MISQYEELLKDCQLDVDTDYPVAISKVFNLSTGHVLLMMCNISSFKCDTLIQGTHNNAYIHVLSFQA